MVARARAVASAQSLARPRISKVVGRVALYCWVAVLLLVVLAPLWWMVRLAFSPAADLRGTAFALVPPGWPPRHWPPTVYLGNFQLAFRLGLARYLFNSTLVGVATTGVTLLVGGLAAYSLVRLRYRGRDPLARSILVVYLIPQQLLFVPTFVLMHALRLVDTYWALIFAYATFALPFGTWLLVAYLKRVPAEIAEAAWIDGCGRLPALWRIDLPLAAPGVAAVALITFTLSWGEFLYALVLELHRQIITVPVALSNLLAGTPEAMAGSLVYFLPVLLLYLGGQRFIVAGLAAGAINS